MTDPNSRPLAAAPKAKLNKGTLAAIVGPATAMLLFTQIPKEESGRTVQATIAADGTATVRHISGRQYLRSYLDIVGVATACDGLTQNGIQLGQKYTEAQCTIMLEAALIWHAQGVMRCTPGLALTIPRRDNIRFAAVSLAYNVGIGAYCRSSIPVKINGGNIRAACDVLPQFNKAGGRVNRGLTGRRVRERAYCIKDI